jgi:hypothetical protein
MTALNGDGMPKTMRIGLWGAPGSGKTTFLGALQIAVSKPGERHWTIHGVDDTASNFLSESTHQLRNRRMFPVATVNPKNLRWRLVRPQPGARRRLRRKAGPPGQRVLELEIMDVAGWTFRSVLPGEDLGPVTEVGEDDDLRFPLGEDDDPDEQEALLRHLAACDGLVYLFDPTDPQPYDYVQRTVEQLSRRSYESGRLRDGWLPQHLAVCVTKFDDPAVFAKARNSGLLRTGTDPYGPPHVPDRDAGGFFRRLCTDRDAGSASLVLGSIDKYFNPARVRHFVVSAIGFYLGPTGRFLPTDFVNLVDTEQGLRIRGEVHPINVLQPFHWLEEQLPTAAAAASPDPEPAAP